MRMQAESEMQAALNRFSQQLRTNQEQMAALLAQLSQGKVRPLKSTQRPATLSPGQFPRR